MEPAYQRPALRLTVGGSNVKHLRAVLQCLNKIGSELLIEALQGQLILRTINSAKSAFLSVTLTEPFFDGTYSLNKDVLQTSVLLKHVLSTLRTQRMSEYQLLFSEDTTQLSARILCENGLIKTYTLNCTNTDIMSATVDKESYPVHVAADSKELNKLLSTFSANQEEVTLLATPPEAQSAAAGFRTIQLQSFNDPQKARDGGDLTTAMAVDTRSVFHLYRHDGNEAADVTFNIKDFKAMLGLCDHLQAGVSIRIQSAGNPVVVEPYLSGASAVPNMPIRAELILATLIESQLDAAVKMPEPPPQSIIPDLNLLPQQPSAAGQQQQQPAYAQGQPPMQGMTQQGIQYDQQHAPGGRQAQQQQQQHNWPHNEQAHMNQVGAGNGIPQPLPNFSADANMATADRTPMQNRISGQLANQQAVGPPGNVMPNHGSHHMQLTNERPNVPATAGTPLAQQSGQAPSQLGLMLRSAPAGINQGQEHVAMPLPAGDAAHFAPPSGGNMAAETPHLQPTPNAAGMKVPSKQTFANDARVSHNAGSHQSAWNAGKHDPKFTNNNSQMVPPDMSWDPSTTPLNPSRAADPRNNDTNAGMSWLPPTADRDTDANTVTPYNGRLGESSNYENMILEGTPSQLGTEDVTAWRAAGAGVGPGSLRHASGAGAAASGYRQFAASHEAPNTLQPQGGQGHFGHQPHQQPWGQVPQQQGQNAGYMQQQTLHQGIGNTAQTYQQQQGAGNNWQQAGMVQRSSMQAAVPPTYQHAAGGWNAQGNYMHQDEEQVLPGTPDEDADM